MTINYTKSMCKLNSNLLLLCMLSVAFAGITSFWDMNPVNKEGLECLKEQQYLD
jgi:hypothetical protein